MVPLSTIAIRQGHGPGPATANSKCSNTMFILPIIACAVARRRGKAGELQELNSSHTCGPLLAGILQSQDREKKRRRKKDNKET